MVVTDHPRISSNRRANDVLRAFPEETTRLSLRWRNAAVLLSGLGHRRLEPDTAQHNNTDGQWRRSPKEQLPEITLAGQNALAAIFEGLIIE